MHKLNYLENKLLQLEQSLLIKRHPFYRHKKRRISPIHTKKLPPLHNHNQHVHTSSLPHSQPKRSKKKLQYRSKSHSTSENDINDLLLAKVSAEFDRKYHERKLRYENLLLKERLLKYGKVNDIGNDYANDKETIDNKYIIKLINDQLKPVEDKQKKFMEIINKMLVHNVKDKDESGNKGLEEQSGWKHSSKGTDFIVKESLHKLKSNNDNELKENDNDNDNKSNATNEWELFDYTKYQLNDNSNEPNGNNIYND